MGVTNRYGCFVLHNSMNVRRYVLVIILTAACSLPALAAAANFVPLVQNSQGGGLTSYQTTGSGDLSGYINRLFIIALSVGAMLAVLRLVYAGYIYMVSGVGNFASMGKAKEIIGRVVFGLLLLLGIYLILYQINLKILELNITQNIK